MRDTQRRENSRGKERRIKKVSSEQTPRKRTTATFGIMKEEGMQERCICYTESQRGTVSGRNAYKPHCSQSRTVSGRKECGPH